jgi:hypothetical protein
MSNGALRLLAGAGAVDDPVYVDDVFSTYVYTGVYSNTDIVNGIDLAGEGGLVWTKKRNSTRAHDLSDTARGVTKSLYSSAADAEGTDSQGLLAFNSNGYRIGGSSSYNNTNDEYVSWTFRKAEKFFDIVTYSGNATNGRAINHNLGSVPGMILIKSVTSSTYWPVFHRSIGKGHYLFLNTTDTKSTYESGSSNSRYWNDTDPTATQFTVSNDGWVNGSGQDYVAYLFAHNDGDGEYGEDGDQDIIKCGSYSGNDGTQDINLGFEPQWVLIKSSSDSGNWVIVDMMRGFIVDNSADSATLQPNTTNAESSSTAGRVGPRSNGFGFINESGVDLNALRDYIYVAIRRPNKPASEFAATDLFALDTEGSAGSLPGYRSNSPVDMALRPETGGGSFPIVARLTQGKQLYTNGTNTETSATLSAFDYQNGFSDNAGVASNRLGFMFTRSVGFFDVVTYVGTGSARTIIHNLGAVPELMIAKNRSNTAGNIPWVTYDAANGATKYARLESENAVATYSGIWNDTAPTNQVFSVGSDGYINGSSDLYIIYLFASVAGISKVGSYTGTGSDLNVDCGFSAGARFILIKRTDSSGGWYVYDSLRGIVAGNDPYLLLNSTAAQVTNTDYIDPLSSGFTVTSSAPAGLNASSGTYIFLAIA